MRVFNNNRIHVTIILLATLLASTFITMSVLI